MGEKRPVGRPPGKKQPHMKTFRFSDEEVERLASQAAAEGVSEAEVVRRALADRIVREEARRRKSREEGP